MYKEAIRKKYRYLTTKGSLSVEQLWDLSLKDLDDIAVKLEERLEKGSKKSFIKKRTVEDKVVKTKFDIVVDIINTKLEEQQAESDAAENKAHNETILEVIKRKQQEELEGLSVQELEAKLK